MRHESKYARNRKLLHGFTLVELLVVISIIALLLSILLPSLSKARELSKRVICGHNLHEWGIALMVYAADNDNRVPKSYTLGAGEGGGLMPAHWAIVEPQRADGSGTGQINIEAMMSYMPAGHNFNSRDIGDPWTCPSAKIDWKFFIDIDPSHGIYHNKTWDQVVAFCRSSISASWYWLPLCYTYFALSDEMFRDPRTGTIRMNAEVVSNMQNQLAKYTLDGKGRRLIMSDTLYRWPGEGAGTSWWFNHSKKGPSTHEPDWSRYTYFASNGPPPITGANQLYTDGSVVWKKGSEFDTKGMNEGTDPSVPQTLFGTINVSPSNLACFW